MNNTSSESISIVHIRNNGKHDAWICQFNHKYGKDVTFKTRERARTFKRLYTKCDHVLLEGIYPNKLAKLIDFCYDEIIALENKIKN
jgi:hypothetical protein